MASYLARKYRYADGCVYNANRYVLLDREDSCRTVGGALVLKGRAIAFVGMPIGDATSAQRIVKCARCYAWGTNLAEALRLIRPALENRAA